MVYFVGIVRVLLGVTFLFSAYTKAVAPGFFEITLIDQGIAVTRNFAAQMTRFIIGMEFSIGLLMLLPFYTKRLMVLSAVLLSVFSVHLVYLVFIGDNENCGCFGEMISMTPAQSLLKNLVLFLVTMFVYFKANERKINVLFPILGSSILTFFIWFIIPIPDNSDFPFKKFSNFESIGRVDLSEKNGLVAIFNLDCEHCQDAAKEISTLKKELNQFPNVFVLFYKEGSTSVEEFEKITETKFPYALIDVNDFFDLIGNSPPRIYQIEKAQVKNIWDDSFYKNIKTALSE
ncbi:MAG: hypothetical protein CMC40_04440 [Flavobacteriaceae bacterium]|nr:hypothetical protein [Flavobacteriaceae bacterium]